MCERAREMEAEDIVIADEGLLTPALRLYVRQLAQKPWRFDIEPVVRVVGPVTARWMVPVLVRQAIRVVTSPLVQVAIPDRFEVTNMHPGLIRWAQLVQSLTYDLEGIDALYEEMDDYYAETKPGCATKVCPSYKQDVVTRRETTAGDIAHGDPAIMAAHLIQRMMKSNKLITKDEKERFKASKRAVNKEYRDARKQALKAAGWLGPK